MPRWGLHPNLAIPCSPDSWLTDPKVEIDEGLVRLTLFKTLIGKTIVGWGYTPAPLIVVFDHEAIKFQFPNDRIVSIPLNDRMKPIRDLVVNASYPPFYIAFRPSFHIPGLPKSYNSDSIDPAIHALHDHRYITMLIDDGIDNVRNALKSLSRKLKLVMRDVDDASASLYDPFNRRELPTSSKPKNAKGGSQRKRSQSLLDGGASRRPSSSEPASKRRRSVLSNDSKPSSPRSKSQREAIKRRQSRDAALRPTVLTRAVSDADDASSSSWDSFSHAATPMQEPLKNSRGSSSRRSFVGTRRSSGPPKSSAESSLLLLAKKSTTTTTLSRDGTESDSIDISRQAMRPETESGTTTPADGSESESGRDERSDEMAPSIVELSPSVTSRLRPGDLLDQAPFASPAKRPLPNPSEEQLTLLSPERMEASPPRSDQHRKASVDPMPELIEDDTDTPSPRASSMESLEPAINVSKKAVKPLAAVDESSSVAEGMPPTTSIGVSKSLSGWYRSFVISPIWNSNEFGTEMIQTTPSEGNEPIDVDAASDNGIEQGDADPGIVRVGDDVYFQCTTNAVLGIRKSRARAKVVEVVFSSSF